MIYFEQGSIDCALSENDLKLGLEEALKKLGKRNRVLLVPPDNTRIHSKAGELVQQAWDYYGSAISDILPALGTHAPMTGQEISRMFGDVPESLFRNHDWRRDVKTVGHISSDQIRQLSEGQLDFDWPVQVNRLLLEGDHDLILSVGQVVPHEVVGMANHHKNILIGTGGADAINLSHYLGAVYGMERMMGRIETPVREILNRAFDRYFSHLPIVYILTVVGRDPESHQLITNGLFIGDDYSVFEKAAELSLKVNVEFLDEPLEKIIVFLPPSEFKTTWLGNKSIYRTRMAIADGGELIVLAPGLRKFGEDEKIDGLIRKYGYGTTAEILEAIRHNADLRNNLSAAAHLIHGSTENRFRVTYCPGYLTREEIEGVNYRYGDLKDFSQKYDVTKLTDGFNTMPDGERIFFISNPALGLWAHRKRFE